MYYIQNRLAQYDEKNSKGEFVFLGPHGFPKYRSTNKTIFEIPYYKFFHSALHSFEMRMREKKMYIGV